MNQTQYANIEDFNRLVEQAHQRRKNAQALSGRYVIAHTSSLGYEMFRHAGGLSLHLYNALSYESYDEAQTNLVDDTDFVQWVDDSMVSRIAQTERTLRQLAGCRYGILNATLTPTDAPFVSQKRLADIKEPYVSLYDILVETEQDIVDVLGTDPKLWQCKVRYHHEPDKAYGIFENQIDGHHYYLSESGCERVILTHVLEAADDMCYYDHTGERIEDDDLCWYHDSDACGEAIDRSCYLYFTTI